MFCKNCGSQLQDDAKFCTTCGSATETTCVPASDPISTEQAAHDRTLNARKKKVIALVSIVCIVAVVAFLLLRNNNKYASPEAVARDFVIAQNTLDVDKLLDCIPDFLIYYEYGTDREGAREELQRSAAYLSKKECTILNTTRSNDSSELETF